MKKQYERPYAEKVEFDYRDSVAACYSKFTFFCDCVAKEEQSQVVTGQTTATEQPSGSGTCQPNTSYWVKTSSDHWGC